MSSRLAHYLLEDFRFDVAPGVVSWAEQNLVLPRSMSPARPGPFSTQRQPTSRPILECFHPTSGVRLLVNVAGAQTAKTTEGVIGTSYRICHSPMPMLILGPSEDWLRLEISEKRLGALINENPILRRMKPFDSSRFRKMAMEMIGGTIAIEGANSPVATAGSTQGIVWIEEAAKIEHQSREDAPEAHPIKLAFERTKFFRGLELHYLSFTPNRVGSISWQYYLSGTQTHFHVPCPHCREFFPLEFELRREGGDLGSNLMDSQNEARPDVYRSLIWSPDARDASGLWNEGKIRATCVYVCPVNGCEIHENERLGMIAKFETKDHNPAAPPSARSFRRPSFYSPTVTFADIALEFLRRGDLFTTGLQNFYNSWLAQPWEEIDANVKDEDVRKLRDGSDYRRGFVPRRPYGLALAADVGDYRTHWEVGAIFDNGEIAVIDWGTVLAIEDLNDLQGKLKYPIIGTGDVISCSQGLVDSRDQKLRVYEMCQRSRGFWWPADGADADHGHWGMTRLNQYGLDLFTFNAHAFKTALYKNAIKEQQAPRVYLPRDADEDLIHGHGGQQLLRISNKKQWKKIAWDHYGDCTLRLILAKLIFFWKNGRGAPDIAAPAPPSGESFPPT